MRVLVASSSTNIQTRPERFELPTFGSVDRRSIQLSYGRVSGESRGRQAPPERGGALRRQRAGRDSTLGAGVARRKALGLPPLPYGAPTAQERRGRDSNPRDRGYRSNGFQDRRIQPLCHPSGCSDDRMPVRRSTLGDPRRGGRAAEGTRLLSEYGAKSPSRVRIPPSPSATGASAAPWRPRSYFVLVPSGRFAQ